MNYIYMNTIKVDFSCDMLYDMIYDALRYSLVLLLCHECCHECYCCYCCCTCCNALCYLAICPANTTQMLLPYPRLPSEIKSNHNECTYVSVGLLTWALHATCLWFLWDLPNEI